MFPCLCARKGTLVYSRTCEQCRAIHARLGDEFAVFLAGDHLHVPDEPTQALSRTLNVNEHRFASRITSPVLSRIP